MIVDFSYKREILLDVKSRARSLVVLDHHQTAQKDLEGLNFCKFDMTKSGAMLTWEYFYPSKPPTIIEYVQDRDLWQWKLPSSKEVSAAIASYPFDFDIWDELSISISQLVNEGRAILRYQNQVIDRLLKNAYKHNINGDEVLVVNTANFQSEVGERLCLEPFNQPFGVTYFNRNEEETNFSLRSRKIEGKDEVDVSIIAKAFGGGGHKNAAGFVIKHWFGGPLRK